MLKVFRVSRTDGFSWNQDVEMIVVAKDFLHAERIARQSSEDFKKNKSLKVKEIDLDEEAVLIITNTGA